MVLANFQSSEIVDIRWLAGILLYGDREKERASSLDPCSSIPKSFLGQVYGLVVKIPTSYFGVSGFNNRPHS